MGWGQSQVHILTRPTTGPWASDFTSWSFSFLSPCLAMLLWGPGAVGGEPAVLPLLTCVASNLRYWEFMLW